MARNSARKLPLVLLALLARVFWLLPTSISALSSSTTNIQKSLPRVLLCDVPENVIPGLQEQYSHRAILDPVHGWTDQQVQDHLVTAGDVAGLIVRSANTVSKQMIESSSNVLRVIGRAGVGLDNIDCEACAEAQIPVVTAAGANAVAVAEHALSLMLALARRIKPAVNSVAEGRWEKPSLVGLGLRGKTLGIVGFGAIGWEIANIGSALGMKVLIAPTSVSGNVISSDDTKKQQQRQTKVQNINGATETTSLEELLKKSDFVSVQLPLTDDTRNYIGSKELDAMKTSAMLISVGRGGVVDETALLESLETGNIAGAALDVFENEGPDLLPQDETLLKLAALDSTVITPHVGGHTEEAQADVWMCVVENLLNALEE